MPYTTVGFNLQTASLGGGGTAIRLYKCAKYHTENVSCT